MTIDNHFQSMLLPQLLETSTHTCAIAFPLVPLGSSGYCFLQSFSDLPSGEQYPVCLDNPAFIQLVLVMTLTCRFVLLVGCSKLPQGIDSNSSDPILTYVNLKIASGYIYFFL